MRAFGLINEIIDISKNNLVKRRNVENIYFDFNTPWEKVNYEKC
jgi:hypothetical protein